MNHHDYWRKHQAQQIAAMQMQGKILTKRTGRKPLTDEAIHQMFKHLPSENRDGWVVAFARAIERAHGIGDP